MKEKLKLKVQEAVASSGWPREQRKQSRSLESRSLLHVIQAGSEASEAIGLLSVVSPYWTE